MLYQEKLYTAMDDAWESAYIDVVSDGQPYRASVSVTLDCKECNTMLLNGDGWIDLYTD
jgi:hypothetical protein